MIDWHSHILPDMDDGSRDVAESLAMLAAEASQGVDTVIATPHFYANDESVADFLERRSKAWKQLKAQLPVGSPEILLGAEVKYYQGISRLAELQDLRIQGSKLLLLEMPVDHWTEYTIRELTELSGKSGIKIVLAHIERYLRMQKASVWHRLYESGILMQANASFFVACTTKHRALSLLAEGGIHFIGTDCHNMTSRAPRIAKTVAIIDKKIGEGYVNQMDGYGKALLAR